MGILNFFKNKVKNEQNENKNNNMNTVGVNNETEMVSKKKISQS